MPGKAQEKDIISTKEWQSFFAQGKILENSICQKKKKILQDSILRAIQFNIT